MNRIEEKLKSIAERGEKALALFLTAGFPRIDSTADLVLTLEQAGADIIELGVPFSDPLADGPIIQASSAVALKNGVTLPKIFGYVKAIRRRSDVPLVLMGYMNPMLAYGTERFLETAAETGVDGIIVPDLPFEEADSLRNMSVALGLANIFLVTPESSPERIAAIDAASTGFLYCVSTRGVTGSGKHRPTNDYLRKVKRHAKKNPVLVGFGISRPDDAKRYSHPVNGVIVGSSLIKMIGEGKSKTALAKWARKFKDALR
jgi:tryptophan synthase alpha chain